MRYPKSIFTGFAFSLDVRKSLPFALSWTEKWACYKSKLLKMFLIQIVENFLLSLGYKDKPLRRGPFS